MAIFIQCGEQLAESGEPVAELNNSFDNITSTLVAVEDDDTLAGAGLISAVTGVLVAVEDDDTLAGAGTIGGIGGTLVAVEDDDITTTAGIIGNIVGVLVVTENNDVSVGVVSIADIRVNRVIMFLDIFKHLLPNAKAWRITINKRLRQFFDGLTGPIGIDIKTFFDNVWLDMFPETTRELDAWEKQFGLRDTGLNESERRDRLATAWRALGGQDPRYIEDILRGNGFDVYVHEWWVPGSDATVGVKAQATPRNPLIVLSTGITVYFAECGEAVAECGELQAVLGDRLDVVGYPLVNKISNTQRGVLTLAGEPFMDCGELQAVLGDYSVFIDLPVVYVVPADPTTWPYFLYIGGAIFGELAQIDPKRRDEFEALCLKICPAQQWLGILAEYV